MRRARLVWSILAAFGLLIALAAPADAEDGQWDPTLPPTISAGAPGDPLAVANQSLQATASATQTTLDLGRQFLGGLGINLGGSDGGGTSPSKIPRANGRQAIEYVIRRGASQMGVPYSWGGGTLDGPSKGIDSGANTVG
ncbi:MAG: peptidase C40, partial [Mycobacterium sp.]